MFTPVICLLGYLSSPCFVEGTAFFQSKTQPKDEKRPQIQLHLLNTVLGNSPNLVQNFVQLSNLDPKVNRLKCFEDTGSPFDSDTDTG